MEIKLIYSLLKIYRDMDNGRHLFNMLISSLSQNDFMTLINELEYLIDVKIKYDSRNSTNTK
jgi:hypothetical protein